MTSRQRRGNAAVPEGVLSAEILMRDGRTVDVPVVQPPAGPASAGKAAVAVPYPAGVRGGEVDRVTVLNRVLGFECRALIYPAVLIGPGDVITVTLDGDDVAGPGRVLLFGDGEVTS